MTRAVSGFTLIELMITIAVLAVLVALAAPSFNDSIQRARLKGAADGVVSLIEEARQQAGRLDRDVNLTLRGSGENWCVGALQDFTTIGNVVLSQPDTDYQLQVGINALGHARVCVPSGTPTFGGYRTC